jgi:hypothetical protein
LISPGVGFLAIKFPIGGKLLAESANAFECALAAIIAGDIESAATDDVHLYLVPLFLTPVLRPR